MGRTSGLTKKNSTSGSGETKGSPSATIPQLATTVEQNVKPIVAEAQQVAAKTSVSGRHAVSRGTIFLAFYLWFLSGAIMISLIARYTQFFPGDKTITRNLQKQRNPFIGNQLALRQAKKYLDCYLYLANCFHWPIAGVFGRPLAK